MKKNEYDLEIKPIEKQFEQFFKELPKNVSNFAVNDFKQNFRRRGYIDNSGAKVPWKKRKADKTKSSKALLIKSGALRRGIQPSPKPGVARVINRVHYSKAHNEGVKGTVTVKSHMRTNYKKPLKGKRKRNSFVVKSHKRKMNLPARPFMITSKTLLIRIDQYVDSKLDKIFK